jgi:hypothetical protein
LSLTTLDLNHETRPDGVTFRLEPVPPLRKIWIGFALAFAYLVAEIFYSETGRSSGAALVMIAAAIAGWMYWLSCVQRFHTILRQISPHVDGAPTYPITSGQAVGYHFIPFLNFVWLFKWPMTMARFLRENSSVRMMSGFVLGLLVFCGQVMRVFDGFLGLFWSFLVTLYISRKLQQAVAEHESLRTAADVFS